MRLIAMKFEWNEISIQSKVLALLVPLFSAALPLLLGAVTLFASIDIQ